MEKTILIVINNTHLYRNKHIMCAGKLGTNWHALIRL
jgi:hypothetical protein